MKTYNGLFNSTLKTKDQISQKCDKDKNIS